jgi:hypothetical protein
MRKQTVFFKVLLCFDMESCHTSCKPQRAQSAKTRKAAVSDSNQIMAAATSEAFFES